MISDVDTNAELLLQVKESFAFLAAKEDPRNEAICSVQTQLENQSRVIQELSTGLDRLMRSNDRLLKKLEDIENIVSCHEGTIEQILSEGSQSS